MITLEFWSEGQLKKTSRFRPEIAYLLTRITSSADAPNLPYRWIIASNGLRN